MVKLTVSFILFGQAQPYLHSVLGFLMQHTNDQELEKPGVSENGSGDGKEYHQTILAKGKRRIEETGSEEQLMSPSKYHTLNVLCRAYDHLPHYKHSLELLLHQVLQVSQAFLCLDFCCTFSEKNAECQEEQIFADDPKNGQNCDNGRSRMFVRVVEFLRDLDVFLEVVVGCARYTIQVLFRVVLV